MDNRKKNFVRMIILILSCVFLFYGTARGEVKLVLNKAVNICLECIGLG